jgi:hypothetical protein
MSLRRPTFAALVAALLLLLLVGAPPSFAGAGPTWRLEQPAPPAPPAGVAPAPFPVPLGAVGDIQFWAPNRGLLVTAGTAVVPQGLYAYDGTGWHQLSTVCGGTDGRIAFAGPDDVWTIADQRTGQTSSAANLHFDDRSLCHIVGGQVVSSYALPQGQANSYQAMHGAACASPTDCWFGGDLVTTAPPYGAFHLHWDGSALRSVPSLDVPVNTDPAHAIQDIAVDQGQYYESVHATLDDPVNPAAPDPAAGPTLLHAITSDLTSPFVPLDLGLTVGRTPTDTAVRPTDFAGLLLGGDGHQLWAAGGSTSRALANVVVVHLDASGSFQQLTVGAAPDGGTALPFGSTVSGVAAEPGGDAAWVAFNPSDNATDARVARIAADGSVTELDHVPAVGDPAGPKGTAGPIACPAPGECWMATSKGWLYHLTDGTPHARDTDLAYAGLITTRPADQGVPFVPPLDLPIDDSGATVPFVPEVPVSDADPGTGTTAPPKKAKALVAGTKSKLVHKTTLELTFTLRAKAHVQLIAKRRGKVVAKTKRVTLKAGKRIVKLKLNRKKWPTALQLKATAFGAPPAPSGDSGADAITTRSVTVALKVRTSKAGTGR